MQIKTTKRYHCTPIRRAKIQNMGDPKHQGDVEPRDTRSLRWGCNVAWPLGETGQWFRTELNALLRDDPAITSLGGHSEESKIRVHTEACTWMFMAALF